MTRRPSRHRDAAFVVLGALGFVALVLGAAWLYGAYERDCLDRGGRPVTDTMGHPTGCLLP